jgi:hypothetical protein
VLRQLDATFTTNASTAKLRLHIESAGEDFLVCDPHALQADGTDSFDEDDFILDANADGVGGAWTVFDGSPSCEWYGEDWSGLDQWIEKVSKGALTQFELRRPGSGHVIAARLVEPLADIGAALRAVGVVNDVALEMLEVV